MVKRVMLPWRADPLPGVEHVAPGTIADMIIHMDQEGVPPDDRVIHWMAAGVSKRQVEEAEEIVVERYKRVSKSHGIKQRHGRKW